MSRAQLIESLNAAVVLARRDIALAAEDGRVRWAHISAETVRPFAEALLSNQAIAELQGQWYSLRRGAARLDLRSDAVYLIDRALDYDAAMIIDDLLRFCVDRTIELVSVRAVEGITVGARVDLGDGFFIAPPSALPTVAETRLVFSPNNVPKHGWGNPPTAAIGRTSICSVQLLPPTTDIMRFHASVDGDPEVDMEYALLAATLSSNGAPEFRQAYDVVTSVGWLGMACGTMGASESFPVRIPSPRPANEELLPRLFQSLRKQKGRLNLAISKLQSSRRRNSFAERAIDLGTCIEVLLMHGESNNTEIGYKIASRAAWLLGSTGTHRLEIFKRAQDLYKARSTAVHNGVAPKIKGDPMGIYPALDSYDALCAAAIINLADRDEWPNWTSLVLDAEVS